ncbi:MAG: reactive intermediate/imine deaminase [Cyanobacteria bacterium DS2.3.42]|jgi:2-iminobutanoate/2-iminopropanoate deaminase|nr:reactive intermediate/imine deaminase [Cyanobacteria bacterium DS2.3.42]
MKVVATDSAPKAIGPYSQAIVMNGMVFVSGQIPIDPATGNLIDGPIADQTKRVMTNLAAILEAAGASLAKVVKTTVYLKDMGDFAEMNEVYGNHFPDHKPARATVQVAKLPRDVGVEIDCIAFL